MRNIIIAGNWKMNKDAGTTRDFCVSLARWTSNHSLGGVLPLVAPVFPFVALAYEVLHDTCVAVSAQDVSSHVSGAYTGEVSAAQLGSIGISHCIIGHSERRQYHSEADSIIREKLLRLRENSITPILCIGETLEQRESGHTEQVVLTQLSGCLRDIPLETGTEIVIAYEPVWAIGTGKTATAQQAQEVHSLIRNWLADSYSRAVADTICVLYGGSVKPDNIAELLAQPDIDGGLIGGASLKIEDFCAMLETASQN